MVLGILIRYLYYTYYIVGVVSDMKLAIIGLLALALLVSGCVSNSEVQKVDSTPTSIATASPQQANIATPTLTAEPKTVKTAVVGETLTNGKLKITLNEVKFTNNITGASEYLTSIAKAGNNFVVVDLTLDNTAEEATAISSVLQFKVESADGYRYQPDLLSTVNLGQQIDGKLQPASKIRGKLSFEVPLTTKGLLLAFDFGLVDLAQAKFRLGDAS